MYSLVREEKTWKELSQRDEPGGNKQQLDMSGLHPRQVAGVSLQTRLNFAGRTINNIPGPSAYTLTVAPCLSINGLLSKFLNFIQIIFKFLLM